jgi:hypothetical protein
LYAVCNVGEVGYLIYCIIHTITCIIFAIFANGLYYNHINNRIKDIQNITNDSDTLLTLLSKKSQPAKWVIYIFSIIVPISVVMIVIPHLVVIPPLVKNQKDNLPISSSETSAPIPAPNSAVLNNEVNKSTVKFIVQDNCNDGIAVQYRFFDVSNNLCWPSSDKVYTTSQYQTPYVHELSCKPGANICFGATTYSASPTVQWGVGINNDQVTNLDTSCVSCGSVTEKYFNLSCP